MRGLRTSRCARSREGEIAQAAHESGHCGRSARRPLPRRVLGAFERSSRRSPPPARKTLLDQPEFQDLRKLRSILRIVEEQKTLYQIVADAMSADTASVKIGHELGSEELADLSVVTVPYHFGAHALGMLSILGPRRMPYARLLALATGTAADV